jgi:rhamnosyltransferase
MRVDTQAVFAHFDPDGLVAPHVTRHLEALSTVCDRITVVSTAALTPEGRRTLREHGELLERPNEGYDFGSWQAGVLDSVHWARPPRLIIANDSTVGPLRPLARMLDEMSDTDADVWGAALSEEYGTHLQSFFLVCDPRVVGGPYFRAFWESIQPLDRRWFVIHRYELGLSRMLLAAGYRLRGYFTPSPDERVLCDARRAEAQAALDPPRRRRMGSVDEVRVGSNPMLGLWDRALPEGRLPFVKLEFLRDDPYHLGAEQAVARCETAFPKHFDGVREYLARTREAYLGLRT